VKNQSDPKEVFKFGKTIQTIVTNDFFKLIEEILKENLDLEVFKAFVVMTKLLDIKPLNYLCNKKIEDQVKTTDS